MPFPSTPSTDAREGCEGAPPTPPPHPQTSPERTSWRPVIVTSCALLAGVALFFAVTGGRVFIDPRHVLILQVAGVITVGVLAVGPFRGTAIRALEALRHPSSRLRRSLAVILTLAAGGYFYLTALSEGRRFMPVIHDEYCYLLQSRIFASGHLWMPRHDAPEFFDSFHLVSDPAYAPKYGPGAALMFAPALAAGLPYWVTPLALTALSAGLLYLVVTHWLDGAAGLLAVFMLPTLRSVRRVSIEALSQPPMMVLVLIAFWAFLHWRRERSMRWLAVMSAAVGYGAITRPVDALALAAVLALAVLFHLRGASANRRIQSIAVALTAIAPFLLLQALYNKGVTGSWARLPWSHYGTQNDPYDRMFGTPDSASVPADLNAQKRRFIETSSKPIYDEHVATGLLKRLWTKRLVPALGWMTAHPLLLVLTPLGLLAGLARGRSVPLAFMLGFLLLYGLYPYYLAHYTLVLVLPCALLVLGGWEALADRLPRAAEGGVRVASFAAVLTLTLISLPQLQRVRQYDEWSGAPVLRRVDDRLAAIANRPALVFVYFDPAANNPNWEPVYNVDTAWPDDAKVIRAHDLGPERNLKLLRYYAQSPDRRVYRYDRSLAAEANSLTYLGTVRQLAGAVPPPPGNVFTGNQIDQRVP